MFNQHEIIVYDNDLIIIIGDPFFEEYMWADNGKNRLGFRMFVKTIE